MHSRTPLKILKGIVSTPDVLLQLLSILLRKHLIVNYDYYIRGTEASTIKQISIKITNMCNLRCKMCGQWGETGYNIGKPVSEINKTLPLEVYKKLADDVVDKKPIFYIWGGEPFLYPEIMPFLSYLKEKKFITSIVTNGIKLRKNAEELVEMGLDCLMVSLDGPREIHNEIRGSENCFDTLIEGIQEINEKKRLLNKKKPYIVPLVTISKYNADYLEDIFEVASTLETDCLVIYYSWFTTPETGQAHTRLMESELGCTPFAWKGYIGEFSHVNTDLLMKSVSRIKQKEYPFFYIFVPDLKINDIPKYYESPRNMFGYSRCIMPWLAAELMPNGDLAFCRDYPDYIIGNITQDSIINIYNNERAKKFRKLLKDENGLFPICARCCGLMGW